MTFVLIVIAHVYSHGVAIHSHEFATLEACRAAAQVMVDAGKEYGRGSQIMARCIAKGA